MAYDRLRDRIVLFGGLGTAPLGDTWEWNGSNWTRLAPTGAGPSPRYAFGMTFDEAHGCTLWIAVAGRGTWMFRGPSFDKLSVVGKGPVLVKGGEHFDRDYAGLNSVLTSADGKELFGFYHAEFHPDAPKAFPFLASLGLATSADGGTWKRVGQVIAGLENKLRPGDTHNIGACEPSAVLQKVGDKEFIYLYWGEYYYDRQGAIYLARSPHASGGRPGTWQFSWEIGRRS